MSQKRYFWEIFSFCFLWVALFVTFFLIILNTTTSNTSKQLNTSLEVAERIFDGNEPNSSGAKVEEYFKSSDADTIRVSIITKESDDDYSILFDSQNLMESTEKAKEIDNENLGKEVTRNSSYNYNMIYLACKDKENPSFYVRVSIKESSATAVARNSLIYGSICIVAIMAFYIYYKIRQYQKSIKPLKDQIQRLAYISGEEPKDIAGTDDLSSLTDSINTVSKTLDKKISDLEVEKEKTKMILDSISQGFLAISDVGNIVLFNKAASDIFKYHEEDVLHKSIEVLTLGDAFKLNIKNSIVSKKDKTFDYERDGRIYQVNLMPLNYPWLDGSQTGLAILILDQTEERNLAKTKNDFFSNASHELKSPLTSILGYQQMIDNGIFTTEEDKEDAVKKTIKEAERMKDILSDMLTINRLENKHNQNLTPVNLKDSALLAIESLTPLMNQHDLKLNISLDDVSVIAEKLDMDKLFQNLLSNAVKYNHKHGSINISISKSNRTISIKDTGIGIKQENLARIFERFYRVDNSRSDNNVEGTGLGLAIVKHICQLYGFSISVKSVYGEGSEFIIKF